MNRLIKSVGAKVAPEYDEVSIYFAQLDYTDVFVATGFDESVVVEYIYGGENYQPEIIYHHIN